MSRLAWAAASVAGVGSVRPAFAARQPPSTYPFRVTQTSVAPLAGPCLTSVLDLARDRHAEGLGVADLADHAGYSPFHFTRMFSAAVGLSPGQYLTALRIDSAKRLLLADSDPVIDIATAVGFDSLSSFSRRFRTTVGIPPAALRKLADQVADRPPRPFRLVDETRPSIVVRPRLADGCTDGVLWLGWFPLPAPVGLPLGGVLVEAGQDVRLPIAEGAPWLLGFHVPASDDVLGQLTPEQPVVTAHPTPITSGSGEPVVLDFGPAANVAGVPLLTALPSLCRH